MYAGVSTVATRNVPLVSPLQPLAMYCWCLHCSHSQSIAGVATAATHNVLLVSPLQPLAMYCWCRHRNHSQCTAGVATATTRNVLLVSPLQPLAMYCWCRHCSHSQCHRPTICLYVSSHSAGTALPLKMGPDRSTETSLTNYQTQKSADRQLIQICSIHHHQIKTCPRQNSHKARTCLHVTFPGDAVVTAYGLNDPQRQIHLFSKPRDQPWGPPRLIFNWY